MKNESEKVFLENYRLILKAAAKNKPMNWEQEDWVQECLMHIWSRINHFDPTRGKLSTWVYHLLQNLYFTHLKASGFKCRAGFTASLDVRTCDGDGEAIGMSLPDRSACHTEAVARRMDIQQALGFMSPAERTLADLKANGENRSSLSRSTKQTRGALQSRWKRARLQMAESLKAYANE